MRPPRGNYAFIDNQNINLGVRELGWTLDWRKFRTYLAEEHGVGKAFMFVGFLPAKQHLYFAMANAGFTMVYRPVLALKFGEPKANVDVDLAVRVMGELHNFKKAVIATSDGDFYSLVAHLATWDKLEAVISPSSETCSALLKQAAKQRLRFLDHHWQRLQCERKNDRPPRRDGTHSSDLSS